MQHLDVMKVSAHKAEALVDKRTLHSDKTKRRLNYKLLKLKVDLELDILGFK
jgi:hypothetical protein